MNCLAVELKEEPTSLLLRRKLKLILSTRMDSTCQVASILRSEKSAPEEQNLSRKRAQPPTPSFLQSRLGLEICNEGEPLPEGVDFR